MNQHHEPLPKRWIIALLLLTTVAIRAQTDSALVKPFPQKKQVEADFLFHYYEQDGQHAAVTGGIGTEELTDMGAAILVLVPLDSIARMEVASSLNHYSSASTDNIDSYLSSASQKDSRVYLHVGYGRDTKRSGWSAGGGGSFESDYLSTSLTGSWYRRSTDGLKELSIRGSLFLDTWLVIFPEELRAPGLASVPTNKRRSLQIATTWAQPINPRMQFSVTWEPVVQQGLLSTAFHRVYFQNDLLPRIEKLPLWRIKMPIAARLHYYATDFLVLRGFYRFYWDSWGIVGHTAMIEAPLKMFSFVSIFPFYRFHWQGAAQWFAAYGEHESSDRYYSSDYDLSGFISQQFGAGLSITPLYGLGRWKMGAARIAMWERIDLRYSRFLRSDGLDANSFTLGVGFRI
ncbi:MAG: DUF3570 domain-containing protein [Bacteroidia bacterium]|nr:DUF3570 domain-containing protein [Bacteroidia bacterium]